VQRRDRRGIGLRRFRGGDDLLFGVALRTCDKAAAARLLDRVEQSPSLFRR